ncbi:MAG: ATP-binding protein [Myxococcales bacterium]|nr:ATP-binding protein [Myxococcales bacterium]
MQPPRTPENEAERLSALRSYRVLDTEPEPAFDDLAQLAAHILGTPIALVSLIDTDRQWFKARYGLDAPQTPRDVSFCGHVVATETPLVVNDAFQDSRFADNPLVVGNPRVIFYAGVPLRTDDGFVLGTLCTIDHSSRQVSPEQLAMLTMLGKQVVAQLEARRRKLQVVAEREAARALAERVSITFDAMAEGVVVQDPKGQIIFSNRRAGEILGLTPDQLNGRTSIDPRWRSIRADGSPFPGVEHPAMVALSRATPIRDAVMGIETPDGRLTWISINALPKVENGVSLEVVTTFHDITALETATRRASQQERLATVGTLAAGVGHEVNNPLAYVIGNVDFALDELREIAGMSPSGRLREIIDVLAEAREGADRIRKIVRGLRSLAREDVALHPVDVQSTIETALSMAAHEVKHRARVTVSVDGGLRVHADEARLTQVLVNLAVNAAQAFTSSDPARNAIVIAATRQPGKRVSITVKDNGPGIPPELQRRVFDPFFTTKPVGQGTGLGLSVSRSIVDTLGGELTLESSLGAGASFTVVLPEDTSTLDDATVARRPAGPRRRVMIVDDEQGVVDSLRRVLVRHHEIDAFSDPRAALKALEAGREFDLILCDVTMPFLSGAELYEQVRVKAPAMAPRFAFITGGATSPEAAAFLAAVANPKLEKPFDTATLLELALKSPGQA